MEHTDFDIIVVGGGVAGLSAAVFASLGGAQVGLFEQSAHVGGAMALSDGLIWAPHSRLATTVGVSDPAGAAEAYLENAVGGAAAKPLQQAMLRGLPEAIQCLLDEALIDLQLAADRPDYRDGVEGAAAAGRALKPAAIDGRSLGRALEMVRPGLAETMVWGGLPEGAARPGAGKPSLFQMVKTAQRFGQYVGDRMRYGRAMHLTDGQALVAQLVQVALDNAVEIQLNAPVTDVSRDPMSITVGGATIGARHAVIVATGGFASDPVQRAAHLAPSLASQVAAGDPPVGPGLHQVLLGLGARYGKPNGDAVLLAPHSVLRRADDTQVWHAHTRSDGAKPGVVMVDALGQRFANEAMEPHRLAAAQNAAGVSPAYLIADAEAVYRYGLGLVPPGTQDLSGFLNDNYLMSAQSLDALAFTLGMDAAGLVNTAKQVERFAEQGEDQQFGRGRTPLERASGDPNQRPNPNLRALKERPFYAVRVAPGVASSALGFETDPLGQLLDANDTPMIGLYAIGDDMQSVFGGNSVAPGQTMGQAIGFAYLAARHALARIKERR